MIAAVLESVIFQCLFLVGYDLFLKNETFFQWNRTYLIGTFLVSLCIPFIHIEALRTSGTGQLLQNSAFMYTLDEVSLRASGALTDAGKISWHLLILGIGSLLSAIIFAQKLWQLRTLKSKGVVEQFPAYTRVLVPDSSVAFSFFRAIFLGVNLPRRDHQKIIMHELVHVRQRHSYDLMLFEVMRMVFWFNPLVYIYQSRIAELHEYIADAQIPKAYRKEQYQFLLSRVFESRDISFINQFFSSSLIKKRIVMLKKPRSSKVSKLKYVLLLPLLGAMMWYSSCKEEAVAMPEESMQVSDVDNLSAAEEKELFDALLWLSETKENWNYKVSDGQSSITFYSSSGDSYISGPNNEKIRAGMLLEGEVSDSFSHVLFGSIKPVPFRMVEEVPVFPGCEDAEDRRACFQQKLMRHIQKNFHYPDKAITQGVSGRVNVFFTIDENGLVSDINKKGPHPLLEGEADRIIARLPRMTAGRHHGKAVKVPFSLPITFKLD